ncbi:alpha/beta fold hydrolase [Rhodobacteraceae bacterium D3-12]|nr:alpha/beta fold hydrolase [Rhodobacteraceae bacterium D3-12]
MTERPVMTLLKLATLLLTVSFGGLFAFDRIERELVYPFDPTEVSPRDIGLSMRAERFESGGQQLVVWVAQPSQGKPVILYFHGNAGNLAARAGRFQRFMARGYGVVAPAYRGSSGSSGQPNEAALSFDAGRILQRIGQFTGDAPVVIYGESLGTGVTLTAVDRAGVQPAAVVLEAPFTSVRAVALNAYPQLAPVIERMKSKWDSLSRVKRLTAPLLVLHGTDDSLIPIAQGRQIHAAARASHKQFREVKGGHHTDLWRSDVLPDLWRFIDRFGAP